MSKSLSGGCQCGAVRFECTETGRPSICHCRMCQKAFGSFFGALVTAKEYRWTRGEPSWFQSSNLILRGFCNQCGTPLAYRYPGGIELAIATFDKPGEVAPEIQINTAERLACVESLAQLPAFELGADEQSTGYFNKAVSNQHPDHDTDQWPSGRSNKDE